MRFLPLFQLSVAFLGLLAVAHSKKLTCNARDLPAINVDGLQITDLHAEEYKEWSDWQHSPDQPFQAVIGPISYCGITVTYTHPGLNDSLNVYIGLPSSRDDWNGRYLGIGGGGWLAGWLDAIPGAVSAGYVAAVTDGGHGISFPEDAANAESWSMRSKGNTDWNALQNFASRSLDDMPKIAKQVIKGFYGEAAAHSYWVGCSTGGRQGLMSAQRYPENYDGIVAVAPAINWASFLVAELWPQVLMNEAKYWPPPCEYEAIRQEALKACAEQVSTDAMGYDDCQFDALSVVGNSYDCFGSSRKISKQAAELANGIWQGPVRNGKQEWFGNMYQIPFGGYDDPSPFSGLAITTCDANNRNCKGAPFVMSHSWAKDFLMRDLDWDIGGLNEEVFWKLLHASRNQYESIMSTNDPDLSEFKARGGKIVGWHGKAPACCMRSLH